MVKIYAEILRRDSNLAANVLCYANRFDQEQEEGRRKAMSQVSFSMALAHHFPLAVGKGLGWAASAQDRSSANSWNCKYVCFGKFAG
jgi:hypothetical protein